MIPYENLQNNAIQWVWVAGIPDQSQPFVLTHLSDSPIVVVPIEPHADGEQHINTTKKSVNEWHYTIINLIDRLLNAINKLINGTNRLLIASIDLKWHWSVN